MARTDLPNDWKERLEDYNGKLTIIGLSQFFGVTEKTIRDWKGRSEDFAQLFEPEPPISIPPDADLMDVLEDLRMIFNTPKNSAPVVLDHASFVYYLTRLRDKLDDLPKIIRALQSDINRLKVAAQSRPPAAHRRGSSTVTRLPSRFEGTEN